MSVRPKKMGEAILWFHQEKLTFFVAGFSFLMLAVWALMIAPKAKAIHSLKKELAEKKLQWIGTEEAAKHIHDIDALIAERRVELDKLNAHTLAPGQEASIIQIFSETTESLPIVVLGIQPESEPPITEREPEDTPVWRKEGFRKSKLTINLQCRYQTLGLLLERLSESHLSFEVERLNMSTKEGLAPNLDIQMVLTAYVQENA